MLALRGHSSARGATSKQPEPSASLGTAGGSALRAREPDPKLDRLDENLGTADVTLTIDDLREIREATSQITVNGKQLREAVVKYSNR